MLNLVLLDFVLVLPLVVAGGVVFLLQFAVPCLLVVDQMSQHLLSAIPLGFAAFQALGLQSVRQNFYKRTQKRQQLHKITKCIIITDLLT